MELDWKDFQRSLALGISSEYYIKLAVLNIRSGDFLLFLGETCYYTLRELCTNKKNGDLTTSRWIIIEQEPVVEFLLDIFDLGWAPRNRDIGDDTGLLSFEDME